MARAKDVTRDFTSDGTATLPNISRRQDATLLLLAAPMLCGDLGFCAMLCVQWQISRSNFYSLPW